MRCRYPTKYDALKWFFGQVAGTDADVERLWPATAA